MVGRLKEVDSAGDPAAFHRLVGPVLAVRIDESFRDRSEIALAGPLADFSAALPAGSYRWRSPCQDERVAFTVFPGEVTHVGTLRILRGSALGGRVTFHQDYEYCLPVFDPEPS